MSQDPAKAASGLSKVDLAALASSYPVKDLFGCDVINEGGETIGQIDNLLLDADSDQLAFAVLSVGGFLGMGAHKVVVSIGDLRIDREVVLPGATKDSLKGQVAYDGATEHGQNSPLRSPRRGVKEERGRAVRTAFGEPIAGRVSDITDAD